MEKREIIDMATGIGGGLLLILAIVLFAVVPQDEPVPPTFFATYVPTETTVLMGEELYFTPGQTEVFPVEIPADTVHRIAFNVEWTDDEASSLPDTFQFVINGPDGERVTDQTKSISNDPPNATGTPATTYTANPVAVVIDKSIAAPPRDGPVPGEALNEDENNARSRLREDLLTHEPGTWEIEVYLDEAGGCPSPQDEPARALQCTVDTANAGDQGNSIRIVSVTYTTYEVEVEQVIRG